MRHVLSVLLFISITFTGMMVQPQAAHAFVQADGSFIGDDYVLAASWQPSFCETKPDKDECESQTGDRFDATHFAIHGLWP